VVGVAQTDKRLDRDDLTSPRRRARLEPRLELAGGARSPDLLAISLPQAVVSSGTGDHLATPGA
jgi:hypothetical protein